MRAHRDVLRFVLSLFVAGAVVACGHSTDAPAPAGEAHASAAIGGNNEHGLPLLRNPLVGNAAAIEAGRDLFVAKACSGCHGANGGGGMCPSLLNEAWVYGDDDTTLYNLIRRGSVDLRAHGYVRGATERNAGDMPPLGGAVSEDEAWKLLAYVRSWHPAGIPST
jgi:mono/diheme cytochrome c family protein